MLNYILNFYLCNLDSKIHINDIIYYPNYLILNIHLNLFIKLKKSLQVRLAAMIALSNSLIFAKKNMDIQQERDYIMTV